MIKQFEKFLHYVEAPAIRGVNKNIILNLVEDDETIDMFYREPTEEDIKFLGKYLRQNRFNLIELYHGTASENNIMDYGLLTTKKNTKRSQQSETGFIYASVFEQMAKTFGQMGYPKEDISVYKITVPVFFLKPDEDQLRNQRVYAKRDVKDTLAESALYGHGFRIKGDIPPYMIKKI